MKLRSNKKLFWGGSVFIVWLFISTSVITAIYNRNTLLYRLNKIPLSTQIPTYYALDAPDISSGIMNTVTISGWIFLTPEKATGQKTVSLIFESDSEIYAINTSTTSEALGLTEFLSNKGIPVDSRNMLFSTRFSPLNFKNGQYQLFLYCTIDNSESGLIETNYFFEKTNEGFKATNIISPDIEPLNKHAYTYATGWGFVDSLKLQNGNLCINGWTFLDGADSTYQKVYIEIKDANGKEHYFRAFPCTRLDLLGHKSTIQNYNAGFSATIKLEQYIPTKEAITVHVIHSGKIFSFSPTTNIGK